MKIGIYTIFKSSNFGAQLQAYATQEFLRVNGFESEIVNYSLQSIENTFFLKYPWTNLKGFLLNLYILISPQIWLKKKRLKRFQKRLCLSKKYSNVSEFYSNPPVYDVHLVGSDQVWNLENSINSFFFLPFLSKNAYKISYASSFGNVDAARKYKKEITQYLLGFEKVSVREKDAECFLKRECNIDAQEVIDPIFLLPALEWNAIAGEKPIIKGGYILYYGFDKSQLTSAILSELRRKLNIPIVGVSVSLHSPYYFDTFYQSAGPEEFVNLIKYASFIVTSSFHGLAFSLNFRKDFIVLSFGSRMARMESLLSKARLSNRLVNNLSDLESLNVELGIDYAQSSPYIEDFCSKSREWLKDAISKSWTEYGKLEEMSDKLL